MDINQIENNIEALLDSFTEESFIYGLLAAYGLPNAAVTRLRNGEYNLSKDKNQILWKKRVCYQIQKTGDLHSAIDVLKKTPAISKQHPRFLIVTDFTTLLAIDTDNSDSLDIPLKDLSRHFDFFLPWAGMEKSQLQRENPADIKAAERMGRLYDLILEENPIESEEQRHSLNVFFTRLLFCYFAEDTGIFPSGIFVNGIASHTSEDGSDLQSYLFKVFETLNQQDRGKSPAFLAEYPYVNGGLFATSSPVPRFNAKSRKILIECGALNWKAINPDIFGSMMQAVVHTDERSGKGMHYTSVVNIMKVIEPLFLNDLREELENAGDNKQKLQKLLDRIYNIRIFDPACGSGNFLIIAYKELCKLEIEVFKRLNPHGQKSFNFLNKLKINQFYGIEIDDFAHETAKLSLWLAEHQMNLAFREVFGDARPTLPLQDGGNIFCGNAIDVDWDKVCPKQGGSEVMLLGNPPYIGARNQNKDQKLDIERVLGDLDGCNDLDYVACWIRKAADYIRGANARFAFVTTNSITQGSQVALIWPHILVSLEIGFAFPSFKWSNNARGNAGVTCVIIGVRNVSSHPKRLFGEGRTQLVKNISPYLIASKTVYVHGRKTPLSKLSPIVFGSMANDGGHLLLDESEYVALLSKQPKIKQLVRRCLGSREFINGISRYCLWIEPDQREFASSIPEITQRVKAVEEHRNNSNREATQALANEAYRFAEIRHRSGASIIIPSVSSERREYIPIGFLDDASIISNLAFAIYDASASLFAIVSSRMHMVWIRAVAGRLKTDYRYSAGLCYNTFPIPEVSAGALGRLEQLALDLLHVREQYSEKTLAQLYDPELMPSRLREVHGEIDLSVDQLYRSRVFSSDDERLEVLFQLYEDMSMTERKVRGEEGKCQISLM
jgi:hypothetical protein